MQCKYCDKETVFNTSVCHQHGGHRIRYGAEAPNFKNGSRTKEAMESRERLQALTEIGNLCGFMHRKMRGRKPIKPLLYDLERFKQLFKGLHHEIFNKQDN